LSPACGGQEDKGADTLRWHGVRVGAILFKYSFDKI
jgi:hypothetical protein